MKIKVEGGSGRFFGEGKREEYRYTGENLAPDGYSAQSTGTEPIRGPLTRSSGYDYLGVIASDLARLGSIKKFK